VLVERCGWAVLGGSPAALRFAAALAGSGEGVPVTVLDAAGSSQLRALLPAAAVADSLHAAVSAPGVQAVYVGTTANAHLAAATAAAAARRAVLLEPPLTADLADAEAVVAACDGRVAGTAYPLRWHPAHLAAAAEIDAGALGDVHAVTAAGVEAAAFVDLVGLLLGDDVAALRLPGHGAGATGAVLTGSTRRGVSVALLRAAAGSRLEVLGTAGTLTATGTLGGAPGGTLELASAGEPALPVPFDATRSPEVELVERFSRAALGAGPWGYHLLRDLRLQRLLQR